MSAEPAAAAPRRERLEPYRLLFPLGAVLGMLGTLVWIPSALDRIPWPGPLHHLLMIEGFETCFIVGFLLTAMPGFLHADRCHPLELALALLFALGAGACALAQRFDGAQAFFALALIVVLAAGVRRVRAARQPPPTEMVFVLLGLLMGIAGSALLFAGARGAAVDPAPNFGLRLVSLGMVLSLVLGVGGLLVPTFLGVARPLEIRGIAAAHERRGRLPFYFTVCAALILAFVLEALGHPRLGAWTRVLAATPMLALVWKLGARPARADRFSFALRGAGASVLAGVWLAALAPAWGVAAYHFVFIGGFGLLTLGIGTRVVAAHGGYGVQAEPRLLTSFAVRALLLALAAREIAELLPASAGVWLAVAGLLWAVAWAAWLWRATPMLIATRPRPAPRPQAIRVESPR